MKNKIILGLLLLTAMCSRAEISRAGNAPERFPTVNNKAYHFLQNQPPTVKIIHPTPQSIFYANDSVTIEAQASDADGQVTTVEFYAEGILIGVDNTLPYTVKWIAAEGATSLRAIVYDNNFESAYYEVIVIANKKDFDVRIIKPDSKAKVKSGEVVEIEAYVSPVNQKIQRMEFFVNDQFIGWDSVAPYSVDWISEAGVSLIKAIGVSPLKRAADSIAVLVNDPAKNQDPVVRLMDYYNGSLYSTGTFVQVHASATDADGSIADVEFFVNGVSIGTDTVAPYNINWKSVNGVFEITAVATDNKGAKSRISEPLKFFVGPTRTIKIVHPLNSGVYKEGAIISIEAYSNGRETAPVNQRSPVTFYVNDQLLGEISSYPYKLDWTAKNGKAVIRAVTTSSINTQSDTVTIFVADNAQNKSPHVSIIHPNNRIYNPGERVSIEASAKDEDGTIASVSFYVNDSLIGIDSAAPYRAEWTSSKGISELKAIAKDNETAVGADSMTINVVTNTPPVVKITNPKNGEVVIYGTKLFIAATATDTAGEIKQVAFFVNGQSAGIVTTWPYEIHWPIVNGNAVIKAIATDDKGLTAMDSITAVMNVDLHPTQIKITSPQNLDIYKVGENIALQASVTTSATSVDYVQFRINDSLFALDSVPPYHINLTRNTSGLVKIIASAIHVNGPGNFTVLAVDIITIHVKHSDFEVKLLPVSTGGDIYAETYLAISAVAEDSNDSISSVEFFAEGVSIGVVTKPPYTTQWFTKKGTAMIKAVATNHLGKTTTDSLFVDIMPGYLEFDTKKPFNGQVFTEGDIVDIEAVLHMEHFMEVPACVVEFFVNDVSIGVASGAKWNSVYKSKWKAEKGYAIIKLIGSAPYYGYGSTTSSIVIKVNDTVMNDLPKVSLIKPLDGDSFKPNQSVKLEAEAFDTDGYVRSVSFYVDDQKGNIQLIATDTSAPYTGDWIPMIEGTYMLSAVAKDNLGALGFSRDVSVIVSVTSDVKPLHADKWINVYPNPAKDKLNILTEENAVVQLLSVDGKQLLLQTNVSAQQAHSIELQSISNGSYVVKVYNDRVVSYKKIVISR